MELKSQYSIPFVHEKKTIILRYHSKTTESELATVILYIQDVFKALFDTENVEMMIDGEAADLPSILLNLDKEITIVTNDDNDEVFDSKPVIMYINTKNQLIRISKKKQKDEDTSAGRDMKEIHEILSFDINKLDYKNKHDIVSDKKVCDKIFKEPLPVIKPTVYDDSKKKDEDDEEKVDDNPKVRKKVAIKDGVSQQTFALKNGLMGYGESSMAQSSEGSGMKYFTSAEVAQHKSADDCWTIWQGKVYDITTYIKSHPGGKKIMAGAGKDCTDLFNKYHHWVNAHFLIGKLQVGYLKDQYKSSNFLS